MSDSKSIIGTPSNIYGFKPSDYSRDKHIYDFRWGRDSICDGSDLFFEYRFRQAESGVFPTDYRRLDPGLLGDRIIAATLLARNLVGYIGEPQNREQGRFEAWSNWIISAGSITTKETLHQLWMTVRDDDEQFIPEAELQRDEEAAARGQLPVPETSELAPHELPIKRLIELGLFTPDLAAYKLSSHPALLPKQDEGDTEYSKVAEAFVNDELNDHHRSLQAMCRMIHGLNRHAGWWEDSETGEDVMSWPPKFGMLWVMSKLLLCVTELAEATEGARKDLMDDKLPHRKMIEVELADAVIREFDLAGGLGLDLAGAIMEKLAYNSVREDHTREHRAGEHGKKV